MKGGQIIYCPRVRLPFLSFKRAICVLASATEADGTHRALTNKPVHLQRGTATLANDGQYKQDAHTYTIHSCLGATLILTPRWL